MSSATIAEIENLIMVHGHDVDDLRVDDDASWQAATSVVETRLEFSCKHCDKKFSNKQALGGHQNAHRMERAMERNARRGSGGGRGGFMDYGYLQGHNPFPPFYNFPSLPGAHFLGQTNWPSMPYFQPNLPIPGPEIRARPPYAYPFPPTTLETTPLLQPSQSRMESYPPHAQILAPAVTIFGANIFPILLPNSPVTPRPASMLDENSRNNQAIMDVELDLTLKL